MYVGTGTSLGYFSPLGKFSAFLCNCWDEKRLATNRVVWHPVSHTSATE